MAYGTRFPYKFEQYTKLEQRANIEQRTDSE